MWLTWYILKVGCFVYVGFLKIAFANWTFRHEARTWCGIGCSWGTEDGSEVFMKCLSVLTVGHQVEESLLYLY